MGMEKHSDVVSAEAEDSVEAMHDLWLRPPRHPRLLPRVRGAGAQRRAAEYLRGHMSTMTEVCLVCLVFESQI